MTTPSPPTSSPTKCGQCEKELSGSSAGWEAHQRTHRLRGRRQWRTVQPRSSWTFELVNSDESGVEVRLERSLPAPVTPATFSAWIDGVEHRLKAAEAMQAKRETAALYARLFSGGGKEIVVVAQ